MKNQRQTGSEAEQTACEWLEAKGYRLRARQFFSRWGELDLVMQDGETLVFIEVKMRRSARYGSPLEAVTARKQQRLTRSAQAYLLQHPHQGPLRFDVVGIVFEAGQPRLSHVQNAF